MITAPVGGRGSREEAAAGFGVATAVGQSGRDRKRRGDTWWPGVRMIRFAESLARFSHTFDIGPSVAQDEQMPMPQFLFEPGRRPYTL
ncbi:MAG: hypothetical protein Q7U96_05805 [Chloroflexota bacterium]|nr:hypothetical protein [Chloroflexota bacterium]